MGCPSDAKSAGGSDSFTDMRRFRAFACFRACSVRRKSTAVGLPNSGWRMFGAAPRGFATARDDSNESHGPCVPEFPTPAEASGKLVGWAGNPTKGGLSNGLGQEQRASERLGAATGQPTAEAQRSLAAPPHKARLLPGGHQTHQRSPRERAPRRTVTQHQ